MNKPKRKVSKEDYDGVDEPYLGWLQFHVDTFTKTDLYEEAIKDSFLAIGEVIKAGGQGNCEFIYVLGWSEFFEEFDGEAHDAPTYEIHLTSCGELHNFVKTEMTI